MQGVGGSSPLVLTIGEGSANIAFVEPFLAYRGEFDAARFDKRTNHQDDAQLCGADDCGKSFAAVLQYRGYVDCWKVFGGAGTGGGRKRIFTDDLPDLNSVGFMYGKLRGVFYPLRAEK